MKLRDLNIKKLSIIIPTFNDANALRNTLLSLSNLPYVEKLDLVVIDGNSKDETADVVREFNHIINVFNSAPDRGEYDAMNIGIDACSADSVLFLMAGDCIYTQEGVNTLDKLVAPCFVPVYRKINGDKSQALHPKISSLFGLPHCHQGIIFKKPLPYFDLKYKISADFKHYLATGYSDRPPLIFDLFYVLYDEGHSGLNYLVRDREIYEISRAHFGIFVGYVVLAWFKIKHISKFVFGRKK